MKAFSPGKVSYSSPWDANRESKPIPLDSLFSINVFERGGFSSLSEDIAHLFYGSLNRSTVNLQFPGHFS